ncbi:tripartite tricarboxylate transporter permease [Oceaniglobus ichthyenteri]|uniref:tripartite tricarboxylate transporter permease n=1 Tax=Oceaniglobus ichthyenteri TaxID=2136177 RepID=UPI000D3905C2|nr:tripartite tricarboxylate transporter permease [Oceaniglobus ichthyenteri]
MDVWITAFDALKTLFSLGHLSFLLLGVFVGLIVGILPGLGGLAGLSLLLPFVYGMEPSQALAMMVGLLAITTTSDTFPSVLMGIPGTSGSQATVMDGFPMARRGEAARALAAAFGASLFGGVFGALILSFAILFARPMILMMGFGEQLMLVLFALTMVGILTGSHPLKGIAACGVGLILGTIGFATATGELRMALGQTYLYDGFPLLIIAIGLFAIPEIIEILSQKNTISSSSQQKLGQGIWAGLRDVVKHKWLVLRCSGIGALIGMLPGLGGVVIDWIAYGHVVQTAKDKSQFGKGDIRGVLAPESANNAKEGGSLVPTLLFGVPGSATMAVLLGGLVLVGIEPGVSMVQENLDLTYTIIWSLAIANIVGTVACLLLVRPISKLTTIPYGYIGPVVIVIVFFAAFQATRDWLDLIALFGVGILGVYMKRFGWSRPALLIGFFLSKGLEDSVYQAVQIYGFSFLERPIVIGLMVLIIVSVTITFIRARKAPKSNTGQGPATRSVRIHEMGFLLVFAALCVWAFLDALQRSYLAQIFPLGATIATAAVLLIIGYRYMRGSDNDAMHYDEVRTNEGRRTLHIYTVWLIGFLIAVYLVGFVLASGLFVLVMTGYELRRLNWQAAVVAATVSVMLLLLSQALNLKFPPSLLQPFLPLLS